VSIAFTLYKTKHHEKTNFATIVLLVSFDINAQPPAGNADKGDTYGNKVKAKGAGIVVVG